MSNVGDRGQVHSISEVRWRSAVEWTVKRFPHGVNFTLEDGHCRSRHRNLSIGSSFFVSLTTTVSDQIESLNAMIEFISHEQITTTIQMNSITLIVVRWPVIHFCSDKQRCIAIPSHSIESHDDVHYRRCRDHLWPPPSHLLDDLVASHSEFPCQPRLLHWPVLVRNVEFADLFYQSQTSWTRDQRRFPTAEPIDLARIPQTRFPATETALPFSSLFREIFITLCWSRREQ